LGSGSFGTVHEVCDNKDGKKYAMKTISKEKVMAKADPHKHQYLLQQIESEKELLMKLRNPFLIKIHQAFEDEDSFYFVMNIVNGGSIFN